jgi:hypothetical protein
MPLKRDRQNAPRQFWKFRAEQITGVMDKGADSRQSGVPAADTIIALSFQMVEERHDTLGVERR